MSEVSHEFIQKARGDGGFSEGSNVVLQATFDTNEAGSKVRVTMSGSARASSKVFRVPKNGQLKDAKLIPVNNGEWQEVIELPPGATEVYYMSLFKPDGSLARTLPVFWVQDIWNKRTELTPDQFEKTAGVKITQSEIEALATR